MGDRARPALLVRAARPGELGDVAALRLRAYEEYSSLVTAEFAAAFTADVGDPVGHPDGAEVLVAEVRARIVGTVTFLPDGSDYQMPGWPPAWCAIRMLAVDPGARGLGAGRLLTTECVERARRSGAVAVGLHTAEFMAAAQHIYESLGFERVLNLDIDVPGIPRGLAYRLELQGGGQGPEPA